jgi:hypothetical protein
VALDLPRSECPRSDSVARVEVIEHAEARETLITAQIKEIVDRAAVEAQCSVLVTRPVGVWPSGCGPKQVQVRLNHVEGPQWVSGGRCSSARARRQLASASKDPAPTFRGTAGSAPPAQRSQRMRPRSPRARAPIASYACDVLPVFCERSAWPPLSSSRR